LWGLVVVPGSRYNSPARQYISSVCWLPLRFQLASLHPAVLLFYYCRTQRLQIYAACFACNG
jgi:hypothetical protein